MELHLRRTTSRRDVARSSEGEKKVVQRLPIGDINGGQAQAPFVFLSTKEIVVPNRQVNIDGVAQLAADCDRYSPPPAMICRYETLIAV